MGDNQTGGTPADKAMVGLDGLTDVEREAKIADADEKEYRRLAAVASAGAEVIATTKGMLGVVVVGGASFWRHYHRQVHKYSGTPIGLEDLPDHRRGDGGQGEKYDEVHQIRLILAHAIRRKLWKVGESDWADDLAHNAIAIMAESGQSRMADVAFALVCHEDDHTAGVVCGDLAYSLAWVGNKRVVRELIGYAVKHIGEPGPWQGAGTLG